MNISEQEKMLFKELLGELGLLISRAINSPANNKFDSGESFNIFLALYTEIKNDLYKELDSMKTK